MQNLASGQARGLALLVALILVGVFYTFWRQGRADKEGVVITGRPESALLASAGAPTAPPSAPTSPIPPAVPPAPPPSEVVVHVAGAVKRPGVYHLKPGARADDAVKAAGGAKPTASLDAVNLAEIVEDGKQLYIPSRREQPEGGAPAPARTAMAAPSGGGPTAFPAASRSSSGAKAGKLTTPGEGVVNINTAGAEELQRLPGIGPAMAARVLAYRQQNGPFTAVEQMMDVSGIGEKRFANMKPFVTIGGGR